MSDREPADRAGEVVARLSAPARHRWVNVEWVVETGSTNTDLVARVRDGLDGPIVRVADHQTGGRGRLERRWESPPGSNLLFSVALVPTGPVERWSRWAAALAVAAVDACCALGVDAGVKWPNDVVVGRHKLGGLLAEAFPAAPALVLGLGLNVGWPEASDDELAATSLRAEGAEGDRVGLLTAVLEGLHQWLHLLDTDPARLDAAHRDRCVTLGRQVRVELVGGEVFAGRAVDLDAESRLLVDTEAGRRVVAVGDVFHLRAGEGSGVDR